MDGCHGVSFWIECEALSGGRCWMGFVSKTTNQLSEVKFKILFDPDQVQDVPNMTRLSPKSKYLVTNASQFGHETLSEIVFGLSTKALGTQVIK